MRTILAIWVARAVRFLVRVLGRGQGTTLPGRIALKIDPHLIGHLARGAKKGAILVSGTNGKTTTARLVLGALRDSGEKVVANDTSANLDSGIASALLAQATLGGSLKTDYLVLELDEHALPSVAGQLKVAAVVLTNLFRDQLDRAGEINTIVEQWKPVIEQLPREVTVIFNGNDPRLTYLAGQAARSVAFGLSETKVYGKENKSAADSTHCPECGALLRGERYMSHLGVLKCTSCKFASAEPTVRLTNFVQHDLESASLCVDVAGTKLKMSTRFFGRYNALNVLAALATVTALGVDVRQAAKSMQRVDKVFGRSEVAKLQNNKVILHLAKNPTGYTEVLMSIAAIAPQPQLVLALNDNWADGQDISWIWDVDFEQVAPQINKLLVTGLRSGDLAVRLHTAGSLSPIIVEDITEALDTAAKWGGDVHIVASYTAMLEARAELVKTGVLEGSWT